MSRGRGGHVARVERRIGAFTERTMGGHPLLIYERGGHGRAS